MEMKRKYIASVGLILSFLLISGQSSASDRVAINFSGKTTITFSEPTSEELKNNSPITSNLYADGIQLVPNNYWVTKRIDSNRYDICYKDWTDFFLRVDTANRLVYRVSGRIGEPNNVVGDALTDIRVVAGGKYNVVALYIDTAFLELNKKTLKAQLRIRDLIFLDTTAWDVIEAEENVFHIRRSSFLSQHFWKLNLNTNKFYSVSREKFDAPVANEMNEEKREIVFVSIPDNVDSTKLETLKKAAMRNEQELVSAIEKFPDYWQAYEDLGDFYVSKGEFKKAADIYARYPLFRDTTRGNRIAVANQASSAGNQLYYVGAVKEARQFLSMAANSGTGSAAAMKCEAILLMVDEKYAESAAAFYRLAKTYDVKLAYSHFLSLLSLLDRQKSAWEFFDRLKLVDYTPVIWNAAFVAHRKEGKSQEDIFRWLLERNRADLSLKEISRYFLSQTLIDRLPDQRTLQNLAELERKKKSPEGEAAPDTPIFSWFADAYVNMRQGNVARSYSTLSQRMDRIKDFSEPYRFVLPYLVWSGIRISHAPDVKQVLDHLADTYSDAFEYHISAAFYAGHQKDHKTAMEQLKLASYNISSSGRPFSSWYQLVEASEWLYESSRVEEYRDLAVSFSKRYQQIYPMYSWAYAVEAKYTKIPDDRTRALAFALYLDPHSERISRIDASEKKKAMSWFKDHNPFLLKEIKEPSPTEGQSKPI